jgi:hypothetical protein
LAAFGLFVIRLWRRRGLLSASSGQCSASQPRNIFRVAGQMWPHRLYGKVPNIFQVDQHRRIEAVAWASASVRQN